MECSNLTRITNQFKDETWENYDALTNFKKVRNCDEDRQEVMKRIEYGELRRLAYEVHENAWNYIPIICKHLGNCSEGLDCDYAHSKLEIMFHPTNFKVKKCKNESHRSSTSSKNSGYYCSFYHTESERRKPGLQKRPFDLSTFKIYKCNGVGCDENCVNYHDTTERRRDPEIFTYSETPCINVRPGTEFLPKTCVNGDSCELAHTKNEVYYHENMYKKHQCRRDDCRLDYCAFLHVTEETTKESKKPAEVDSQRFSGILNQGSAESSVKGPNSRSSVTSKHEEDKDDSYSQSSQVEETKPNLSFYNCKNCKNTEIRYMFATCGGLVCLSCLTKECYQCGQVHLKEVRF